MANEPTKAVSGSPIIIAIGVLLVAASVGADFVGMGGRSGIGLRQLVVIIAGATLVASQVWRGTAAVHPIGGLWVWLGLGLTCGGVEAAHTAWLQYEYGSILPHTHEYYWVMPASYGILFGALGIVGALMTAILPSWSSLALTAFVPGMFAAWGVIRRFPSVHELASIGLAIVVAVLLSRAAAARPGVFLRALQVLTVVLGTGVVGMMVATDVNEAAAEEAAMASLPEPPAGAPNVLLIVLDTLRADRLGPYGATRDTTPYLDRFATQGTVFAGAVSTAPWTLTSHFSMFTGRYPFEQQSNWTMPAGTEHRTLAEALSEAGYATGGFVGNLGYCSRKSGLARGFARYFDYDASWGVMLSTPTLGNEIVNKVWGQAHFTLVRNNAEKVSEQFLDWQEGLPDDRPFFGFVNFYDVHAMYDPPGDYGDEFGPRSPILYDLHKRNSLWSDWSPTEAQGFIDAYDGCARYLDAQVGRMLDELARRGVLDDTLVIVTSDHGELFGEQNHQEHGNLLHWILLDMPLILRWPGEVPAGLRVADRVSLNDLSATITDVVGVTTDPFPGHSLAPYWTGQGDKRTSPMLSEVRQTIRKPAHWPASQGDMKSLYLDGLHYIFNEGTQREELYDVMVDPREENDLASERPEDVARMRAELQRALQR